MVIFSRRAQEFGLTYADARDVYKDDVFNFLLHNNLGTAEVVKCMVCEEVGHITGKRHFHCYVRYSRRVVVNESTFDYLGLHCHIDGVKRTPDNKKITPMIAYLTKEDTNPIANFDYRAELIEPEEETTKKRQPDWDLYIEEGLFAEEVPLRLRADGFSAMYANRYYNWTGFINATYPKKPRNTYLANPDYHFMLPANLALWKACSFDIFITNVLRNKEPWYRPKSLVLIGASRTGKTEWARSLGNHMYFNNLLNLDDWDESKDYIVLDDFSSEITKYLPCWKCFFGGQREFTLTDKYRGKKTVHWGKPMIWLSNEDIFKNLNIEHIDFIKKNCEVVVLNDKLY